MSLIREQVTKNSQGFRLFSKATTRPQINNVSQHLKEMLPIHDRASLTTAS